MATYKQYKDKKTGAKQWEWRGYVCVDPNTGKKVVSARKGFKTKRDAVNDFEEYKAYIKSDDRSKKNLTLKELCVDFFEYKSDKIKISSLRTYKNALNAINRLQLLNPDKKIQSYTKRNADYIFKELSSHYSHRVACDYLNVLKIIFNYAVKEGLISDNPFKKVDTSKAFNEIEEKKKNSFSRDELKQFLQYSKNNDSMLFYCLFHLLAFTGMRQGEARALKWSDIDFKENTISITKTISRKLDNREEIGKTPKTKASYRIIQMDNQTAVLLKNYRDECRELYSKRGKLFDFNDSYLFEDKKGNFIAQGTLSGHMRRTCKRAGVHSITAHGLRHTYVSLMIEAGIQPIEIAHNVGHSDLKMIMNVYDEMTKNRKEKTADKFAQFMAK